MSAGLNEINLLGNLGADAEVNFYPESGTTKAILSLCTEETITYRNGKTGKEKDWHRIILWGEDAEDARRLMKGDQVYVSGKLKHRKYQDQHGQDRYISEIIAHTVIKTDPEKDAQKSEEAFGDDPMKPNNSSNSITYAE